MTRHITGTVNNEAIVGWSTLLLLYCALWSIAQYKKKLGALGEKLEVQTHISENIDEIKWIKELFPTAKSYLDVYLRNSLISHRTILAHAVFSTKEELSIIKEKGVFIAHCPSSNINLTSGVMDAKAYLDKGIKVGLGTDIGAGDNLIY